MRILKSWTEGEDTATEAWSCLANVKRNSDLLTEVYSLCNSNNKLKKTSISSLFVEQNMKNNVLNILIINYYHMWSTSVPIKYLLLGAGLPNRY